MDKPRRKPISQRRDGSKTVRVSVKDNGTKETTDVKVAESAEPAPKYLAGYTGPLAYVRVGNRATRSVNYQSVSAEVAVELPAIPTQAGTDKAYAIASKRVARYMDAEFGEYLKEDEG